MRTSLIIRVRPFRSSALNLSVIMPFYKKIDELRLVFPMNKPYLIGAEVVLCLDEDSTAGEVVSFVKLHPEIRWKVLVNRKAHPWRTPTKALNVGLRHSSNDYVLVVSPESKFVGDLPGIMLSKVNTETAIMGQLGDCSYARFLEIGDAAVDEYEQTKGLHFYGSICFHKSAAFEVGGYDECMDGWGGDDDNFRSRLRLSGVKVVPDKQARIVHLCLDNMPKLGCRENDFSFDYIYHPQSIRCPNCYPNWGEDFDEVLFSSTLF